MFSTTQLDRFVFEKMQATRLPGLSLAIVKDGALAYERGYGINDFQTSSPATPATIYAIASMTKSFVALSLMQLVEQGKLSLDDPISKYVPVDVRPFGEPILIRHFLAHTSGLAALASSEALIRQAIGAMSGHLPMGSYQDLYTFMADAESWAVARPDQRWLYLNEGYLLLGDIVERVSGIPFEDYVKQHIFTPLGMTRSFFSLDELHAQRDKTTPHIIHAEGQTPAPYPMRMLTAAGGILSNVRDLANYIQMYLNQGSFNGQQLVKPESIATMYEKRIKSPAQGGDFGQSYYGYGLGMLDDVLGSPMYGHGGSVGVCTSYMAWLPAHGIGAVVLTNGTGYATSAFAIAALATALGKDPYELPFAVRDRRMQQLTGTYRGYKDTIESRISRAGDFLLVINKDKYGEATTPLIFDRIEGNQHIYYTLAAGSRMDAVFTVHDNGDIDFLFERYLTKKVR